MVFESGRPSFKTSLAYPETTFKDLLVENSSKLKRKEAIFFGGIDYSWQYIDAFSTAFANVLIDLGASKGTKVAVMLPNIPQLVITLFAVWKAGCVAVPLDPWLGEKDLQPKLSDTPILVTLSDIVSGYDVYSKVESLIGSTRVERIITTSMTHTFSSLVTAFGVLADVKEKKREGAIDWLGAVRRKVGKRPPEISLYPDDVALVNYVGPVGKTRRIELSHRALVTNSLQFGSSLNINQGDVILGMTPLVYPFGLISSLGSALLAGAKTILVPLITAYSLKLVGNRLPDFTEALRRYRATVVVASPSVFRAFAVFADRPDIYRTVRAAICLPIPPPEDIRTLFQQTSGIKLCGGYASPEGLITHLEKPEGETEPDSMGQPLPDTEAAVFQAENNDLPLEDNQVGVLGVRGPQFADIYSAATFDKRKQNLNSTGWVITGDYVKRDRQGNYFFVGHSEQVIVTAGQRVWKSEVEETLASYPAVKSCVLKAEKDLFSDEALNAFVAVDPEKGSPTAQELQKYVAKNLALYKVPVKLEVSYKD